METPSPPPSRLPNDLLLHRTLELPANEAEITSELQRTVNVAMAYFEDTLHTRPQTLFYAGPGGAEAVEPLLAENELQVRDLVPAPAAGAYQRHAQGSFGRSGWSIGKM